MATQLTTTDLPEIGLVGTEPTVSPGRREAENFSAEVAIPSGVALTRGTAVGSCKVGGAGTFLGISLAQTYVFGTGSDTVPINGEVNVLRTGRVVVAPTANVVAGGAVYYTPTGAFVATAGTNNTLIVGATYEGTASSGDRVVVRI